VATRDFLLPDLGEGLTEAEIVGWLVAVGDTVAVDQPLAEVETAKAVVEVPSPFAGTIATLHGEVGQEVAVGSPLVSIEVGAPDLSTSLVPDAEQEQGTVVEDADGGSGNVLVGYGTGGARTSRRRARTAPPGKGGPSGPPRRPGTPAPTAPPPTAATAPPAAAGPAPRPLATPPVRKLARDLGVDLEEVPPTGPHGTVTRDDVHAWAGRAAVPPAEDYRALLAPPSGNGGVVVTDADRTPLGSAPPNDLAEERIPVRGVRRAISEKMSRSRREIPEATTWVDVDATALVELRARLSARHPDARITPLAIVLRAVVAGLRRFPTVNARLDGDEIVVPRSVHLGVAAQTDRGLVVPVIRDADRRSLLDLAAELTRLTAAARDGSVTPAELTGSTFTVTNYGAFGVDGGSAIINHPEAAILGVGRITDRPWVVDGALEVRKVCQLSIAFDHRIIDGGEAAGFLRLVADCAEDPDTLLAAL